MPPRLSPTLRLSKYSLLRELKSILSRPPSALQLPQYSLLRELKSISSLARPPTGPPARRVSPDDSTISKQRKGMWGWETAYSKMARAAVEQTLGLNIQDLISDAITVDCMLAEANLKCGIKDIGSDSIKRTKEEVYARIVEYLEFEGYPSNDSLDFKKTNVHDLVLCMIGPILANFGKETGRIIRLQRDKGLMLTDSQMCGYEGYEFIMVDKIFMVDKISRKKGNPNVLIIEAKPSSHGEAMRECLLTMSDMWNNHGKGEIYGFVTTGDVWGMVRYDGSTFQMSNLFTVLFYTMGKEKERWMKESSIVVDCITAALRRGGTV